MGWVEATVKIVTELAWPVVVIVAVLVLRRQLGRLLERMTHFEGPGGVVADFPSEAAATNELSEEAVPDAPGEMTLPAAQRTEQGLNPPESLTLDDLLREADAHPVGAIVRAWNLVEHLAKSSYVPMRRPYSVRQLVRIFQRDHFISDDVVGLADRLQDLRGEVVHGKIIPTRESARDFVEAAWRLATAIANSVPGPVEAHEELATT